MSDLCSSDMASIGWVRQVLLRAGGGQVPHHAAKHPGPSPVHGRRWREAPDEGARAQRSVLLISPKQLAPLAPSSAFSTFSRTREKGGVWNTGAVGPLTG